MYLECRAGGRGGPAEPSCAWARTWPLGKAAGGDGVWILLAPEWQWCFTRTYVWYLEKWIPVDFQLREFKGGRISVVSHIDHWNNMMSIYLWHSLYKWLYCWNPNNIPTPRENHSWCSWGRIQKTYEVGGQISIMMLSLAKNNLICKCCLPDTFHTQYFIFKS